MTSQLPVGPSQKQFQAAADELKALEAKYGELATDLGLAAGGALPPPAGTAADVVSLGRSLFKADWGGALLDVVGFIPLAGDAAKAGKLGAKAKAIQAAIDVAKTNVARQLKNVINGRRAAAKKYWDDIVTEGRKRFDDAIKSCSTQQCKDESATLIGAHYGKTPKGGDGKGAWVDGFRGDGKFVPAEGSKLGKELDAFSANPKLNPSGDLVDGIPYKNGFPDYSALVVPAGGGLKAEVEIIQAGGKADFDAADKALKALTGKDQHSLERELGTRLTWHHKEDGVTMQLVPMNVHGGSNGSGHAGGTSLSGKEEF